MNDYVVRINLKTNCEGKGKAGRKKLIDFCLNNNEQYLAIGWSYVYKDKDICINSYDNFFDNVVKKEGKKNKTINVFKEVQAGDLFWTRDLDGYYWICRAKGGAMPYYSDEMDIGAVVPIEAYKFSMQVTGQIKASFNRPNAGTLQKICGDLMLQYSRYLFNRLCGKNIYEVAYIENDILSNLPDFDLEELVILYLQIKHNYCVLSNSIASKSTTVEIECELISRDANDKRRAVVQVKGGNNKHINAFDYKCYAEDGYTVYFYAPYIDELEQVDNVVVITPDELRSFFNEYKNILPASITMWENLFKN